MKIDQYSGENGDQYFPDFTLSKNGEGLASELQREGHLEEGGTSGSWRARDQQGRGGTPQNGTCTVDLFIWGFYIAFNTVKIISRQVVLWAKETSI